MKRVLVTGATGFIGLEVSKQLAAAGYKPRLMVRRPLRAMALGAIDAEMMQGDLSRPESLNRLLDGVDTVIHPGKSALSSFSNSKITPIWSVSEQSND